MLGVAKIGTFWQLPKTLPWRIRGAHVGVSREEGHNRLIAITKFGSRPLCIIVAVPKLLGDQYHVSTVLIGDNSPSDGAPMRLKDVAFAHTKTKPGYLQSY